jgi:DNA uptake protein ComE-like DNA-binding protein
MIRILKLSLVTTAAFALPLFATGAFAQTAAPQSQPATQQNRMANCNAEAKQRTLTGDARKDFMSDCLSGKVAETPAKAAPAAPIKAQLPKSEPVKAAQPAPAQQPAAPRQAQTPTPQQPKTAVAPAPAAPAASLIDVNHASAEQLDGLWGIGQARAAAIIANRPYKSVEDLHARHVIPENVFERIKDQIIAH